MGDRSLFEVFLILEGGITLGVTFADFDLLSPCSSLVFFFFDLGGHLLPVIG